VVLLAVGLHVVKQLVLRGQRLMALNVVHELTVPELAKPLIVNAVARGLPLEIEQVRRVCLLPGREILSEFRISC
jgi:hypothetical protein